MSFSRPITPALVTRWWECIDYPPCILDQKFGNVFDEKDLLPHTLYRGFLMLPRTEASEQASGKSEVKDNAEEFVVKLDVTDFETGDIVVKVHDGFVIIYGKHGERTDEHGFIERNFTRTYMLPEGTNWETLTSSMTPEGVLTITAPKTAVEITPVTERIVPIEMPLPNHLGEGRVPNNVEG